MTKRELRSESLELKEERGQVGRVSGVLIPVGRIASDRQEVFVPGAARFPAGGVRLLRGHLGEEVLRFDPIVSESEIRLDAVLPDTSLGRKTADEIRSGERSALSIEFFSLEERATSGVREVLAALVDSVAVVPKGSYSQARVEIRARATASMFWWAL